MTAPGRWDDSSAPVHADSAFSVELDGETVVLEEATGELHLLNATASLVWQCIDGESTLGAIAADLADVTGAPAERVTDDILALVRSLADKGLLTGPILDGVTAPAANTDAGQRSAAPPDPPREEATPPYLDVAPDP